MIQNDRNILKIGMINALNSINNHVISCINNMLSIVHRQTMQGNAPLQQGANFKIDSHVLGLLPTFHGLPSEDPYRHVDEFGKVFNSINSTMFPLRWPRCASSLSCLRKGQRSGFSPWATSMIHGEI